ncbi:pyridoxal-dependent decarboxylase [Pendulispora brunnea]|uniref:Pyridoxal-dependent decarboxylase n=1 Tax=Pendulispora brunnea TaxID=2905690 RepID=A0ABZ2KD14_9BACT
MTPEQFRTIGYRLVDWIAEYRANLPSRCVMSNERPGAIREKLASFPPYSGDEFDAVLADFERVIVPGITHWNHPSFFASAPSSTSLAAVLGELLASGLGVSCTTWHASPAGTELEELVMDWFRQMLGLSDAFHGVIHDSSSTAALVAALCARERATDDQRLGAGLHASSPLTAYTSDQAHGCVEKALLLAGIGRQHIRFIETDERYAMRADLLRTRIEDDIRAGMLPCVVVATIGTHDTAGVDPLVPIGRVASRYGVWLHIDAATAGAAMVAPECRPHWTGIESADSLAVDLHRWLGAGMDCTAYYVRDTDRLQRVMSTSHHGTMDDETTSYRHWGIPSDRRFRALKCWFLLREQGTNGLIERVRRDIQHAKWLEAQVRKADGWEVAAPVLFQTVCVRHIPHGLSSAEITSAEIDQHNLRWVERVNESGKAYLTSTLIDGRRVARISIGAEATELSHIRDLWALMQQCAGAR